VVYKAIGCTPYRRRFIQTHARSVMNLDIKITEERGRMRKEEKGMRNPVHVDQ
jgi:hypothetical protein